MDDLSDPDESKDDIDDDDLNNDGVEFDDIGVGEEPLELTDFSNINYIITKVSKIMKVFRHLPKRSSLLQTYVKEEHT